MISAPIDMVQFKNTIHKWFVDTTGLFIIWRNQSEHQPEFPYGSLQILNGPVLAAPQLDFRFSMENEQVRIEHYVPCTFDVSCQVYVCKPNANSHENDSMSYLNRAQASLSLNSVQDFFETAGIAYITVSDVQNIDSLIADAFVSRANIDVTFGAAMSLVEYATYIQKVQTVSTSLNVDQIIDGGS